MSDSFRVEVRDETRFDEFEFKWDESAAAALDTITEKITGDAQVNAPIGVTGNFRGSIQPVVERPSPMALSGQVFSSADYAPIIEGVDEEGNETPQGRRAGAAFPNIGNLTVWVETVIAPPEELLDDIVFRVGRRIVQRGLPPPGYEHFRPIGTAFTANEAFTNDLLDQAIAKAFEIN